MVFGFTQLLSQIGLNTMNFPIFQEKTMSSRGGIAVMVDEAGNPIDAYGKRVSVAGRYDKPKTVPIPTPAAMAAARMVVTVPPVKRREVLAMPQPRIAGQAPRLLSGLDRNKFFQQFAVRGR